MPHLDGDNVAATSSWSDRQQILFHHEEAVRERLIEDAAGAVGVLEGVVGLLEVRLAGRDACDEYSQRVAPQGVLHSGHYHAALCCL